MKNKDLSIYVHIPFCSSKCYYCNFCSSVETEKTKREYVKCLINEIKSCKLSNYIVKTIYFGGGTPSVLDEKLVEQILKQIKKKFVVDNNAEITIEANPNSLTREKLKYYRQLGINRLSIGVQTFNRKSLKYVGRVDNGEVSKYKRKVINILKYAKKLGFENISADFILGLPFQTNFHIESCLKQLSKFVSHFSCYMLQIEEGTKLFNLIKNHDLDDKIANQYERAVKKLEKMGYHRYEISNFSKPTFESKHNNVYWERKDYIGFGLSAHSLINETRFYNTSNLKDYISFWKSENNFDLSIKERVRFMEKLTQDDKLEETIMLSLRTSKGLCLSEFEKNFYNIKQNENYKMLLKEGFVAEKGDYLVLTKKGILVANEIIVKLIK